MNEVNVVNALSPSFYDGFFLGYESRHRQTSHTDLHPFPEILSLELTERGIRGKLF